MLKIVGCYLVIVVKGSLIREDSKSTKVFGDCVVIKREGFFLVFMLERLLGGLGVRLLVTKILT